MARAPTLSKSRFTYGLQCHKHLWWRCHDGKAPELKPSALQRAVFARGHRVGDEACKHVPGGYRVAFDGRQKKRAVQDTVAALERGERVLYEAAFEHQGLFAAVDILVREDDGWVLVEVKSTTGVKPQHLPDAAVQTWVARESGITVTRVELMHLNRACVYPDLSNLFTRADITGEVEELLPTIAPEVKAQKQMLDLPVPIVSAGPQCREPYDCPFLLRCNEPLPEGHLLDLYGMGGERAAPWLARGVTRIEELPEREVRSNPIWSRQREAEITGDLVISAGLAADVPPLSGHPGYLDFETLAPAVPVWSGCSPFDAVPAQFSLHIGRVNDEPLHHEWLAEGAGDPRLPLARALAPLVDQCGAIYAWNASFERRCLVGLAEVADDAGEAGLAASLRGASERLVDLLPVVRGHVYHPDFRGSFSLKAVLPVLAPELDYSDLRVADGQLASVELESLLLHPERLPDWRRARMRTELLAYCGRDTLGLVRIHEWLVGRVASS